MPSIARAGRGCGDESAGESTDTSSTGEDDHDDCVDLRPKV